MIWKFKSFDELTVDEIYEILKLRDEIFIVEQNCPYLDIDGKDKLARHLFACENGDVVAASRILPENVSYDDMAIGRIVVKKEYRGRGIAKEMMNKAIDYIINDLKKSKIRLSGQAYLEGFYTDLGFKKVSQCYLEDGIPHFEFLYEVG